jgi:hypothetical protein
MSVPLAIQIVLELKSNAEEALLAPKNDRNIGLSPLRIHYAQFNQTVEARSIFDIFVVIDGRELPLKKAL